MSIPIPPFDPGSISVNRVQPFTLRDGETYLAKLARMAAYLRDLIPALNEAIEKNDEGLAAQINSLIERVNAADVELRAYVNGEVADLTAFVGAELDTFEAEMDADHAQHLTDTEAAVNAILSDLQSDFNNLLEQVQEWQNDAAAANDPITAALITGPSQTREALNPIIEGEVSTLETAILGYVNQELEEKSDVDHTHPASATTSGTFDVARLPVATTGARGAARSATQAETIAETATVEFVSPATLAAWDKNLRPRRPRMVVVGSSNAVIGADYWPAKLGAMLGLTVHNYAIGGSSYTNNNNFDTQVQNAIAGMTETQRGEVSYFFICDASNNSRAKTPYADVYNNAVMTYQRTRDWFPNAKIVVIPQIWPSDTQKYAPTGFPYEIVWPGWALSHADAQRLALEIHTNALFVDESWTWLHARDNLMLANNDVHPNATGHTVIARMLGRVLAGEDVTPRTAWSNAAVTGSATLGGRGRPLATRRDGWDITVEGSVTWATNGASGWDMATIQYGFRPTYSIAGVGIRHGGIPSNTGDEVPFEIWPNGAVRVYQAMNQGDGIWLNTTYRVG